MRAVIKSTMLTLLFCLLGSITSFAGEWVQDEIGWLYINNDSNYLVNEWQEVDGRHYYFGSDGYMLSNQITPDEYWIGADGYWINDSGICLLYTSRCV